MSTSLYIISNVSITKQEIFNKTEYFLNQLRALKLAHTFSPRFCEKGNFLDYKQDEGDWSYEFPTINDSLDNNIKELIRFESPFIFDINVYPACLEINTIYNYNYLYYLQNHNSLNNFRKSIYDIISIFGGSEIIYLADNACDKLSNYLEFYVWEGIAYEKIKDDMLKSGLHFVSDLHSLNRDSLSYSNITEVIFDNFKDF